jgi:hypothetical protein
MVNFTLYKKTAIENDLVMLHSNILYYFTNIILRHIIEVIRLKNRIQSALYRFASIPSSCNRTRIRTRTRTRNRTRKRKRGRRRRRSHKEDSKYGIRQMEVVFLEI